MESKVEMRKIFCDTLIDLAKADERICIVNSDSRQISGTRDFEQAYPDRAFNVGIAEANMVGVAAGLAVSGKTSICPCVWSLYDAQGFGSIDDFSGV